MKTFEKRFACFVHTKVRYEYSDAWRTCAQPLRVSMISPGRRCCSCKGAIDTGRASIFAYLAAISESWSCRCFPPFFTPTKTGVQESTDTAARTYDVRVLLCRAVPPYSYRYDNSTFRCYYSIVRTKALFDVVGRLPASAYDPIALYNPRCAPYNGEGGVGLGPELRR